jgi:hypothetical protein
MLLVLMMKKSFGILLIIQRELKILEDLFHERLGGRGSITSPEIKYLQLIFLRYVSLHFDRL